MIIGIFKKNLFLNSLLLLPFAIIMRLYSLVFPTNLHTVTEGGYLYDQVLKLLPNSPIWHSAISILLVFLQAVLINRLVIKNRFSRVITLLPGMFYIILVSISPLMQVLSPYSFGVFFIILAFINLFKTYKKYNSERFLFNAGLYIGLAVLFCSNLALFIIPLFLGALSIRQFKVREMFQILSGILLNIYFYSFWMYWIGKPVKFPKLDIYSLNYLFNNNIWGFVTLSIFFFLIVNTILTYRNFVIKKSIQSQKKINIVFWILLFSLPVLIFINPTYFYNYLQVIAFPLSFFTASIFLRIKNNLIAEIVSLIIVFAILIYHFQFYIMK